LFAFGVEIRNFNLCLVGRFICGASDCIAVIQQTLVCQWFSATQLPIAYGILLFFQKLTRALNDNFASVYFKSSSSLESYFYFGFFVFLGSLFSAIALGRIHESIFERPKKKSEFIKERKRDEFGNIVIDFDEIDPNKKKKKNKPKRLQGLLFLP